MDKKERRIRDRILVLLLLGGVCAICEERNLRLLQIDHINDDGKDDPHRRGRRGLEPSKILSSGRRLDDLQALCCNCHFLKTVSKSDEAWKKVLETFNLDA